jgi:hypothetical protein
MMIIMYQISIKWINQIIANRMRLEDLETLIFFIF